MKPKPFSIRVRFFLMQSLSTALAFCFISAAIYVSLLLGAELQDATQVVNEAGRDAATARLQSYTRLLYLLLFALALVSLLILQAFRQMHRRHLWEPVGELGRMVREMRRGNLNVTTQVPRSVELGPLTDSFLQMAAELKAAREMLERQVQQKSAELDTTQRKLVEAAKLSALGQLVSGVAHEVNNPLTSILGFSEIVLGNPGLDAPSKRHLQIVRDEALRLKNVVANLSSFARRAPRHTRRMDLRQVLDRVCELRRYQLAAAGVRLQFDRPLDPVWVEADGDQFLQVLLNLLLNAEEAIRAKGVAGGEILLGCAMRNQEPRMWVGDNGVGMSAEVREHIFEPYFTTKPVGEGAGLGLSISHGIVAQHNGRISVESVESEGSTFTVTLPPPAPSSQPLAMEAAPRTIRTPAGHALVIDDERDVADFVEAALTGGGWRCTVLTDALAVESSVADTDFDLVVCDLKMPGRNGLEVLHWLEKARPELAQRFLLMTGNLADADQQSLELARVTVLRKPFTLAQLDEAIRTLLGQAENMFIPFRGK